MRSTSPTPQARAFTLVELLVVIGIIALLVSMLMPALTKARAAGRTASCLSNLKQFGIAIRMYANDHNDCLVFPSTKNVSTGNASGYWWNWLAPYISSTKTTTISDVPKLVQACPEYIKALGTSHSYQVGYGMNGALHRPASTKEYSHWTNSSAASGHWVLVGTNSSPTAAWYASYGAFRPYWKLADIKRPTERIYIGDAESQLCRAGFNTTTGKWEYSQPAPYAVPPYQDAGAAIRHGQQKYANYLFVDGHAESLTPAQAFTAWKMSPP